MLKLILNLIISLLILCTFVPVSFAQTQNNVCDESYFGGAASFVCKNRNADSSDVRVQVAKLVEGINRILLVIAPLATILALIVGAYLIMEKGLTVGIVIIQWALIGLAVVVLSSGIISFVFRLVVG